MQLVLNRHAALGTAWWVEAALPRGTNADALATALIAHLTHFEMRYSRFREDSLTSILNRHRALKNPDLEAVAFFTYGRELYTRTDGLFNCLLGEVLAARGYGTGRTSATTDVRPVPTTDLIVTPDAITLANGAFDPGGFGKGYVIDELATLLRNHGVTDFLINGGGDLYGTSDNGTPFTIYLEHPTNPGSYLGTTTLLNQGFAASSPFKRTWKQGGTTHHHIVGTTDAATFLTAPSAALADAFATAALLLPEPTLITCATKEALAFARYTPATSRFYNYQLPITPL